MNKTLLRRVAKLEAIRRIAKRTTNKILHYHASESVGTRESDLIVWQSGCVPKGVIGRGELGEFIGKFMLCPHFANESDWEIEAQKQQGESLKFDVELRELRLNAVRVIPETKPETIFNEWSGLNRN